MDHLSRADDEYETGRIMWNRAIEKYPLIINYLQNPLFYAKIKVTLTKGVINVYNILRR